MGTIELSLGLQRAQCEASRKGARPSSLTSGPIAKMDTLSLDVGKQPVRHAG